MTVLMEFGSKVGTGAGVDNPNAGMAQASVNTAMLNMMTNLECR
jgi:hypothetical protein